MALRLFTFLLALCLSGCMAHVRRDFVAPADYRYEPPLAAHPSFDYAPAGPVTLAEPIDSTRHHHLVPLSFPSSGQTGHPKNKVEGLYYRSRSPGAKKLVIVLPIWGTSSYPPSRVSRGYARRSRGDAHVIWIYGDDPLFPWDDLSNTADEDQFKALARESAERYRSAVVDLRRLIDWAEQQEEIDETRIGIVGFSMSALVAATLMGNDPRPAAAVFMVGGANLGEVFARCQGRAGDVREHVMSAYGWSLPRYRDFFDELFSPGDPLNYAGRYDPNGILMIDAQFDDCMPRVSRQSLWEATGHPRRITLLYRHRHAFYSLTPLGFNVGRRRIYSFLDDVL
jgi:hypothetical protein